MREILAKMFILCSTWKVHARVCAVNHFPVVRFFRLSPGGVECDKEGLRVGDVTLLALNANGGWTPRADGDLAIDLSRLYGFPVDIGSKRAGLTVVAAALQSGDIAKAQIAALHLQLPEPITNRSAQETDRISLARDLVACGLLKADDDWDAKHPRTGSPPNPGWFANKPKDPSVETAPKVNSGWPPKAVGEEVRKWIKEAAKRLTWRGTEALLDATPYLDVIAVFLETLEPQPTNMYEVRLEQQLRANFSSPKTLDDLQRKPEGDTFGYERHHIVEQNDANVEKGQDALEVKPVLVKFGRDSIDDNSNLVWIPRFKHEQITSEYNSKPEDGQPFPRFRDYVNTLDFDKQRQIGLEKLRKYGVLK